MRMRSGETVQIQLQFIILGFDAPGSAPFLTASPRVRLTLRAGAGRSAQGVGSAKAVLVTWRDGPGWGGKAQMGRAGEAAWPGGWGWSSCRLGAGPGPRPTPSAALPPSPALPQNPFARIIHKRAHYKMT